MSNVLNFDSGIINLVVNGDASKVFSFNPTDSRIYEGFFKLIDETTMKLEAMTKEAETLEAKRNDMSDEKYAKAELLLRSECDKILRDGFDEIFGAGAAETLFGSQNITALGKNGDYIFANAMMAIVPYFESETKARRRKVQEIIQDHKAKAKKKK